MNSNNESGCVKTIGILAGIATIIGVVVAILAWTMPFSPIGSSPLVSPTKQQGSIPTTVIQPTSVVDIPSNSQSATQPPVAPADTSQNPSNASLSPDNLQVGQAWQYADIEFKLDRVEISPDSINIKFYVTNNSAKPFVFDPRYEQGYFQLSDNQGNTWNAVSGASDVVALNPSQSSGDIGPRFQGTWLTNPQVTQLTLTVKPAANAQVVKWVFYVNQRPEIPVLPDTQSQTILDVGAPWNYKDVIFRLDNVQLESSSINLKFYVTNKTGSVIVFETGSQFGYFTLTDSNGKTYRPESVPADKYALYPDNTSGDIGPRFEAGFFSDPSVTYVLVTLNGLFGVQNATWKVEIAR